MNILVPKAEQIIHKELFPVGPIYDLFLLF
jgi:hypothetical protein